MSSEESVCYQAGHVMVRLEMDGLNAVDMSIKRELNLGKMMEKYCKHMGLKHDILRFVYDGKQIKKNHTADYFRFQDGDIINVLCDQMSA